MTTSHQIDADAYTGDIRRTLYEIGALIDHADAVIGMMGEYDEELDEVSEQLRAMNKRIEARFQQQNRRFGDKKESPRYPAGWGLHDISCKWHYFAEGETRSLCAKVRFFGGERVSGKDDDTENCVACKRRLRAQQTV